MTQPKTLPDSWPFPVSVEDQRECGVDGHATSVLARGRSPAPSRRESTYQENATELKATILNRVERRQISRTAKSRYQARPLSPKRALADIADASY
jgi:hypothetical protein